MGSSTPHAAAVASSFGQLGSVGFPGCSQMQTVTEQTPMASPSAACVSLARCREPRSHTLSSCGTRNTAGTSGSDDVAAALSDSGGASTWDGNRSTGRSGAFAWRAVASAFNCSRVGRSSQRSYSQRNTTRVASPRCLASCGCVSREARRLDRSHSLNCRASGARSMARHRNRSSAKSPISCIWLAAACRIPTFMATLLRPWLHRCDGGQNLQSTILLKSTPRPGSPSIGPDHRLRVARSRRRAEAIRGSPNHR